MAWAATAPTALNLHAQPNVQSNIVETLPSASPLVTIYQKDGWSKVGNPTNGKTGWIENNQLPTNAPITQVIHTKNGTKTVTKGEIKSPNGNGHYEVIQYQSQLSPEKSKEMQHHFMAQFQQQQVNFQKQQQAMNTMFNQVFANMDSAFNGSTPTQHSTEVVKKS
jgi:hypothetical protein